MNATAKRAVLGELICAALLNPKNAFGNITMKQALEPRRALLVEALRTTNAIGDPEELADRMIEIADLEPDGVLSWAIGATKDVRRDPEANQIVEDLLAKWKMRRPSPAGADRE